jgi:ferredoxin
MGVPFSGGSETGRPHVDPELCTGCGACTDACPTGVLAYLGNAVAVDTSVAFGCIACQQCAMVCPTEAITVTGRGVEVAKLVGLPPRERRATGEQLRALMVARRSVRHFTDDEVPRATLDEVVAAAASAPMGIPPWEVGVVAFHGRDKVATLAKDVATTYKKLLGFMDNPVARGLLRVFASRTTYRQMTEFIIPLGREIVASARDGGDKALYRAPAALLFHTSPWADSADAFIACTYAMLAAEAAGLGTTMIGCVAPPLARRSDVLARLGIPAGNVPRIVLIIGSPALKYHRAVERVFPWVTWV